MDFSLPNREQFFVFRDKLSGDWMDSRAHAVGLHYFGLNWFRLPSEGVGLFARDELSCRALGESTFLSDAETFQLLKLQRDLTATLKHK
jgi:hypothetical protein